ncbi:MAG: leucyl aminopeptidase [Actinomycetota bacterium]|nr:leucyl aminopeptidase [Actinomycetota bacterium]
MTPPRLVVSDRPLAASDAEVIAVGIRPSEGPLLLTDSARAVEAAFGVSLSERLGRAKATAAAGEVVELPIAQGPTSRALLVGLGDGSPRALRRAGAALARKAGTDRLATDTAMGADADGVRAHLEGLLLAAYRFDRKTSPPERPALEHIDLHATGPVDGPLAAAVRTAAAVHTARDLANTPSNEKDPAWLAAQARAVGRRSGVSVRVRDERQLAAEGFGGILGVGAGSSRPPRLIEMTYRPAAKATGPHVVLVGKGITFDSGGLSLKPREAMVPMKTDMAAGGAVIAVMGALRDAGVRVRVTGLVPAAENLPGASALRPGDVITHYGGRTVEVFNTDAEGRLVLADALAYADQCLEPDLLIDLATLTGAASMGLGRRHGALYTSDDDLADDLTAAGEAAGERLWRMPLVEDYRPCLDSSVADLANISRDPTVKGGSIVAALFLREFVGGRRWAHLDIAGPARAERPEHEVTKGATGFGTRLLLRWLEGLGAGVTRGA